MAPPPAAPRRRRRPPAPGGLGRLALLLPTLVITALCFVIPLCLIAVYSFGTVNQVNFDVYFGWTTQNYRDFTSTLYLHTLARSVVLSVSTTLACAVLGFIFAYYISRQPPRVQRLLLVAVIVPFWTSFIVRTYAWVDLLQNLGPVDRFARALGLHGHIDLLYTPYSIGIGILYSYLPLMILPIYVSLERIDPALYDAAADLGATPFRQFRRVVLPHAVPGLIAGIIIVGVPALGEYVIPEILGGGKTLMAGNLLASQFLETGNYPFGSALAVTVMVVLMVFLFLLRRAQPAAEAG
jgi:spermidine/putrescine transport system permease protein